MILMKDTDMQVKLDRYKIVSATNVDGTTHPCLGLECYITSIVEVGYCVVWIYDNRDWFRTDVCTRKSSTKTKLEIHTDACVFKLSKIKES